MISFTMGSLLLLLQSFILNGIRDSYSINQFIEFDFSSNRMIELKYYISVEGYVDHSFGEFKGDEGWEEFVGCIDFPMKKATKWYQLRENLANRHKYLIESFVDKDLLANNVKSYRIVVNRLKERNKAEVVLVSKPFTITN